MSFSIVLDFNLADKSLANFVGNPLSYHVFHAGLPVPPSDHVLKITNLLHFGPETRTETFARASAKGDSSISEYVVPHFTYL